ncbi:hypothetical protein BGZ83_004581 [Gryganskiella cystojenkinii]|nr:hypothetical protein BGZ83_004581 [Gryganskiella cystojenkinii]
MTDSNNPLFGDFLDLDLLGSTDTNNSDLFSYFLSDDMNSASLGSFDSLGSIESLLSTDTTTTAISTVTTTTPVADVDGVQVKQEEQDIQVLIAHNMQQQEQLRQQQQFLLQQQQKLQEAQPADTKPAISEQPCGSPLLTQLVSSPPPMPTAASAVPSTATTTTAATTADVPPVVAAIASANMNTTATTTNSSSIATAQIAVLIDSSKAAAATVTKPSTKRPSPEPTSPSRKQAKTERASSPKKTERATSPKKTTAAAPKAKEPEPTLATLTSPANTTLSAATLQFLLQQQMQAPLIPQLFTGKLTREEIEDTLVRLLESTKHLIAPEPETIKEEELSDEEMADEEEEIQEEGKTHGLKTQPGIKTDDIPSSTDLKKMTSKERRQLRNKISARNFRVRRKEYIGTLEGQVEQHKSEARQLREAVTYVHEENKRLKDELESMKQQLAQATIVNASAQQQQQSTETVTPTALSNENQSLLASILTRTALNANGKSNITLSMPARPHSPIFTPNLHKDVPNSSSVNGNSWKDKNPVFVHTTLVPEMRLSENFQFGPKAAFAKEDEMWDRPWLNVERTPKELTKEERNPLLVHGIVYELMQTFLGASMDLFKFSEAQGQQLASAVDLQPATVQDYENDKRVGEALEWEMQQDLWAQVEAQKVLASRQQRSESPFEDVEGDAGLAQLLYSLNLSSSSSENSSSSSLSEDANMTEWLYESMMARLVDLDLQSSQDKQTFLPFSEVHYA